MSRTKPLDIEMRLFATKKHGMFEDQALKVSLSLDMVAFCYEKTAA